MSAGNRDHGGVLSGDASMSGKIKYLRIANFRSIDDVELKDPPDFAVFAGPNGSGKSNFFAAMDFVTSFIGSSFSAAMRKYGGYDNLHSWKRSGEAAEIFSFHLVLSNGEDPKAGESEVHIEIEGLDDDVPILKEKLAKTIENNNIEFISRNGDQCSVSFPVDHILIKKFPNASIHGNMGKIELPVSMDRSSIVHAHDFVKEIVLFVENIRLFQINPVLSKEPSSSHHDPSRLNANGDNLARVLQRLEKNDVMRERILEWLNTYVPGVARVETRQQSLDARTLLLFKEQGMGVAFPAHLISDGTIYLLNLLVSIMDRPKASMVMIEEPERGLHPKMIIDLIPWMREEAKKNGPIWLTTHSETVVRQLQDGELWWVEKQDGSTTIRQAPDLPTKNMRRDQAWLSGSLAGGLPW